MNMEMEIQSDDPKVKQQMQSASYWMKSDSWIAPSVPGYDEMRQFYLKMAKELDWLPGTMVDSMNMASPQLDPAMEEFSKNAVKINGMPLLQYVSFGIAATGMPSGQGTGQPAETGQPAPSSQPQAQDKLDPNLSQGRDQQKFGRNVWWFRQEKETGSATTTTATGSRTGFLRINQRLGTCGAAHLCQQLIKDEQGNIFGTTTA
jgi:hypothetical protein